MIEQFLEEGVIREDVKDADIVTVDQSLAVVGLVVFMTVSAALHGLIEAASQSGDVVGVEELLQHQVAIGIEGSEFFGRGSVGRGFPGRHGPITRNPHVSKWAICCAVSIVCLSFSKIHRVVTHSWQPRRKKRQIEIST
jgi:hypothetical protein